MAKPMLHTVPVKMWYNYYSAGYGRLVNLLVILLWENFRTGHLSWWGVGTHSTRVWRPLHSMQIAASKSQTKQCAGCHFLARSTHAVDIFICIRTVCQVYVDCCLELSEALKVVSHVESTCVSCILGWLIVRINWRIRVWCSSYWQREGEFPHTCTANCIPPCTLPFTPLMPASKTGTPAWRVGLDTVYKAAFVQFVCSTLIRTQSEWQSLPTLITKSLLHCTVHKSVCLCIHFMHRSLILLYRVL